MSVTLHSPSYSSDRLYNSVARILSSTMLCSMATLGEKGNVHINTAFFCFSDDLELYFLSNPASVHCQNVSSSPQMAMTVFDSHQSWGELGKGLQLFGNCVLAKEVIEDKAREHYSIRFPRYEEFLDRLSHLHFYRFTPAAIKILDEEEFGDEVLVMAEIVR